MPPMLYHRFTLSDQDVEELLLERGIAVTRESIRTWRRGAPSRWCIKFSDLFAQGLRHREGTSGFPVVFGRNARGRRWGQPLALAGR